MYWCPFCETLNKATADELIKAGEQGKKYKYEFRLCPDDVGKTLDDYIESKGGLPWLEHVADLYGVEATPAAVAAALDKVLGYNFIEQMKAFEANVVSDSEVTEEIVNPQVEMEKGAAAPARAAFKEYITKLDGETLEPPLEVTSPSVEAPDD